MDISAIIGAIVLGIIAGFLARALLPGKQSMGLVPTIVLGLAGSFVGYLIFTKVFGIGDDDAFDLGGIIGAIIGAMILLFAYERFVGSKSPAPAAHRGGGKRERAAAPAPAEHREHGGGERRHRR